MTVQLPEQDLTASFTNRAADLIAAQPWMDTQTAVTLAGQPTSNDQMHAQAEAMGQQLAQSWDGYEQQFYDPILQAKPSQLQQQVTQVYQTLGPAPATTGIVDLQKALAADGFLKTTPTGVWDAQTESAYNQAVNALKGQEFAGAPKKKGNPFTSRVSALYHAVIHDTTHPWDLAVGWYDGVRQTIGDFGGAVGALGQEIGSGNFGAAFTPGGHAERTAQSERYGAGLINALGGHATVQSQQKELSNPLNAAADALSLFGVSGVAKGVVKGVADQALKSSAEQIARSEAERGYLTPAETLKLEKVGAAMSTAQRMGFVQRSINDIGDALRAGTLPADDALVQRNLGIVTKTLLSIPSRIAGPEFPNLISHSWRDNVPALARLAPVAARIESQGGQYAYRIRNLIAAPYRLAPIRAAGIATQRAQIAALAGHAAANLLPGSQLAQNVDNAHIGFDTWLDKASITPIPGLTIGPEDFLLGPLHGDLTGVGRASRVIGDAVDSAVANLSDKLGATGVIAGFEHTTGLSYQQLLSIAGGDTAGLHLWMNKIRNDAASDAWVISALGHVPNWADDGETGAIDGLRQQWNGLPDEEKRIWLADYTKNDPHMQYLRNHIQATFLSDAVKKDARAAATQTDLGDYLKLVRAGQDFMGSGAANYIIGPAGQKAADLIAPWDRGAGQVPSVNREPAGAVGFQKVTSKTSTQILGNGGDLADFRTRLKNLSSENPAAKKELVDDMIGFLHTHMNFDAVRLQLLGRNPAKLLDVIGQQAARFAADVGPTWDQPKWVADKIAALRELGYKPVVGTHIGHIYDGTLPDLGPIDGHMKPLRRYVGALGLDPARIPDTQITKALRNSIMSTVHGVLRDNPRVKLTTPNADVRTVMTVLHYGIGKELPAASSGIFNATAGARIPFTKIESANRTEIARIAEQQYTGLAEGPTLARHDIEHAMAAQMGLRDVNHQSAILALTTSHEVVLPSGATFHWNKIDNYSAEQIMAAVKDGYRLPGYMMGWQAIENWARAGFGFGSKLMARDPTKPLYRAVALWPNKLIQARNALRFNVSPLFSARKNVKQDFKMSLELGRPVTAWNPLGDLERQRQVDQAMKLWSQVSGIKSTTDMEADQYLRARDVFGLYSPQWKGAWFVNELAKRGDSLPEIREAYDRVFKYGAHGGMTAAERTANTIFFPFSFEKTLLRNTGAYLADKPGQALALDAAIEEWRHADKNGQIGQWVNDHLPILREMQLLNGFAHGISPGQFGGINANALGMAVGGSEALLNLFLPQAWGAHHTKANLAKFMPIWGEFKNLWQDAKQQENVVGSAAHDTISSVLDKGWKPEPTLTERAQISYATRKKAALISDPAVRSLIDYNAHQSSKADKYLWPESPNLPHTVWDEPVDKTTIGEYLAYLYPAYDPQGGVAYAKQQAAALTSFIGDVAATDPAKAQQMRAFRTVADQVVSHLNRDEYDAATAAQTQEQFRQAIAHANDPQWKALYSNFYAWALGPLQTPQQKAGIA